MYCQSSMAVFNQNAGGFGCTFVYYIMYLFFRRLGAIVVLLLIVVATHDGLLISAAEAGAGAGPPSVAPIAGINRRGNFWDSWSGQNSLRISSVTAGGAAAAPTATSTSSKSHISEDDLREEGEVTAILSEEESVLDERWRQPAGRRNPLAAVHNAVVRAAADTISTFGFASSLSVGLLRAKAHFRMLQPTVDSMKIYLAETGISDELSKSFTSKLFDNVVILWRIQNNYRKDKDLRDLVAKRNPGGLPNMEEASRYMRFATAAYSAHMIRGTRLGRGVKRIRRMQLLPLSTRQLISEHVGVAGEDILVMDLDFGGEREHLHHFVAKDHANKVVVLSIRGTFSIKDLVVDAAAFTIPFCGGEAHSEIARMAQRTWSAARPYVMSALKEHEDYSLVITGHSLGAGVACLVNILCHQRSEEEALGSKSVRCFAYGCPPVFSPLEFVPDAVVEGTTAYIHGDDVVPFLSLGSVRRLVATLSQINKNDESTSRPQSFLSRKLSAYGRKGPSKTMINTALQGNRVVPKRGCPLLTVPASSVVWTKETQLGHFDAKVCDTKKVSTLGIQISQRVMADHALRAYEEALHYIHDGIA